MPPCVYGLAWPLPKQLWLWPSPLFEPTRYKAHTANRGSPSLFMLLKSCLNVKKTLSHWRFKVSQQPPPTTRHGKEVSWDHPASGERARDFSHVKGPQVREAKDPPSWAQNTYIQEQIKCLFQITKFGDSLFCRNRQLVTLWEFVLSSLYLKNLRHSNLSSMWQSQASQRHSNSFLGWFFFLFFWPHHAAPKILVSQPGIKSTSPALERQNLPTGLPGNSGT